MREREAYLKKRTWQVILNVNIRKDKKEFRKESSESQDII